ncbi:MAG: hypothetical protein CUR33_09530 [Pseudomonas sp.]|nr:MAG: hypothetical protein CUR33_09530 [Pseudomonas sp.] [Pseudomonas sp. FEMGT703P]
MLRNTKNRLVLDWMSVARKNLPDYRAHFRRLATQALAFTRYNVTEGNRWRLDCGGQARDIRPMD